MYKEVKSPADIKWLEDQTTKSPDDTVLRGDGSFILVKAVPLTKVWIERWVALGFLATMVLLTFAYFSWEVPAGGVVPGLALGWEYSPSWEHLL